MPSTGMTRRRRKPYEPVRPRRYTLPNGTVVEEKRSRAPLVILIVLALGALSVHITGFDFAVLVKKGGKFFDILTAMFPPNTGYLAKIWQPLWDTVKMSFLGSFVGAVLAIPFAIAAASNIVTNRVVVPARFRRFPKACAR